MDSLDSRCVGSMFHQGAGVGKQGWILEVSRFFIKKKKFLTAADGPSRLALSLYREGGRVVAVRYPGYLGSHKDRPGSNHPSYLQLREK